MGMGMGIWTCPGGPGANTLADLDVLMPLPPKLWSLVLLTLICTPLMVTLGDSGGFKEELFPLSPKTVESLLLTFKVMLGRRLSRRLGGKAAPSDIE